MVKHVRVVASRNYRRWVLCVLIDTSTWFDLAKRPDGERLVGLLRLLVDRGMAELLVPELIIDEFERHRAIVESAMNSGTPDRFRMIRPSLSSCDRDDLVDDFFVDEIAELSWRQRSLWCALTTLRFRQIRDLLDHGRRLTPTAVECERVVARALAGAAPLHTCRNTVADALVVEMYATALESADVNDLYAFVTSSPGDFSAAGGDIRQPHRDLAEYFADGNSTYRHGVVGLEHAMYDEFGDQLSSFAAEA